MLDLVQDLYLSQLKNYKPAPQVCQCFLFRKFADIRWIGYRPTLSISSRLKYKSTRVPFLYPVNLFP